LAIAEAPSGRILVANQAAQDLTRAADHLPDSVAEYSRYYGFHSDGRRYEPEEWPLARALLTGEVVTGEEIEMLWGDDTLGCLAVSAGPMHDADGRISAAVVVLQDITERRRRDEALRASEERFSKAFFNNPTAMAVLRRKDWTFVEANDGFGALIGREKGEVLGAAGGELGAWFRTLLEQAARRLAQGDTFREQEVAAADKAGQSRTLLVSFDTIEVKGEPCFLATFADLTERKRVDEQLRQSQKMDAIGSLAGGVAHDFNNLLTAINGYSDLMLNRLRDSDPNVELVRSIRAAGERAAGLTRQLLAFSRKERLETSVQSLNGIVEKMDDLLRRMVEENVVLTTRLDPAAGFINANGAQVEQVLLNLVINARDAMPDGGEVRIETHNVVLDGPLSKTLMPMVAGPYVVLAVTDAGTGINPEVQTKIFEPFFTTKIVGKGTGLGLAVVYGIVKGLQGGIEVDSVPGQGTTVRVYIPQARQDRVPRTQNIPSPAAASFPGRETVLVVEDEPTVRKLIRHVLAGLGYRVLTASNGLEALAIVEQGQAVDVLVTDLVMPGLGGRELAARARERSPTLPILFMSGYSADVGIDQDVLSSGENFLAKPFLPGDLARKVREILDRR
ncbi:MAG: ATP-binding protein, partial [Myxococcales bacterium]